MIWIAVALGAFVSTLAGSSEPRDEPVIDEVLAIGPLQLTTRDPAAVDPVRWLRLQEDFAFPVSGDEFRHPTVGAHRWTPIRRAPDGMFRSPHLVDGYATALVQSKKDEVRILRARGHQHLWINGEPRAGDLDELGTAVFPVELRRGGNDLWIRTGRGRLDLQLDSPPAPVFLEASGMILPDILEGEPDERRWASLSIINAMAREARGLRLRIEVGDPLLGETPGAEDTNAAVRIVELPPLTRLHTKRYAIPLPDCEPSGKSLALRFALEHRNGQTLHRIDTSLACKRADETHRRTFRSEVDHSIQTYTVVPPLGQNPDESRAAILALHGASVDDAGHGSLYRAKEWAWIIAPAGRGPFGFDWQEWSRLDALEALADAERRFPIDPQRITVTGHGMGGHGAWHLGALYPDRFCAAAPSAGWIDFWAVGGGSPEYELPTPIQERIQRAANLHRSALFSSNLAQIGIYVLHGSKDEVIPVQSARDLRQWLGSFHPDFAYFEQSDAPHWWGNRSVDWPPLMDFLRHRSRSISPPDALTFTTVNPAVSSRHRYITVHHQEKWNQPSEVEVDLDREERTFRVQTRNTTGIALDIGSLAAPSAKPVLRSGEPVVLELDGQRFERIPWPAPGSPLRLARSETHQWETTDEFPKTLKGPHRAGPFREAFRHGVVLVYGTAGTSEENAWAFRRARFDAETLHVQAQASVELVADVAFDRELARDRNVVLYGNVDTNAAWTDVLAPECPIVVRRGAVNVGTRTLEEDLAVLLVYPRKDSETALVGVVGTTGPHGSEVATPLPYFRSGVDYPDWTIFGPETLERGIDGIRAAGYFSTDWSLDRDAAWSDARE